MAIRCHEFCEIVFADDLNAFKAFEFNTSNEDIFVELRNCQSEVHAWGRANQVSFDASKESMHILALSGGEGPNFKLLGVPFDTALNMKDAVVEIVGAATWKMGGHFKNCTLFHRCRAASVVQIKAAILFGISHGGDLPRVRHDAATIGQLPGAVPS